MVEWLRDQSRELEQNDRQQFTMCLASMDFVSRLAEPQQNQLRRPGSQVQVPIRGLAGHDIGCWQFAAHDYSRTTDAAGRSLYTYSSL